MSKQAFNITVVLVGADYVYTLPNLTDLMGGFTRNELVYYGETISSENGAPIIYLCHKDYKPEEGHE